MNQRPAFQFYPADWRKDPELGACSVAARGLWIELMAIMHECEPRGHLLVNGRAPSVEQLAQLSRVQPNLLPKLLDELLEAGVAERGQGGEIVCRRMVRESASRVKMADAANKRVRSALRDEVGRFTVQAPVQQKPDSSLSIRSETENRSISVGSPLNDGGSLRSAAGAAPLAASAEKPVESPGAPQPPPDPERQALRAWWAEWWRATEGKSAARAFDPATGEMVAARPGGIPRPIAEAYRAKAARIGHEAILAATRRAIAAGNLPRAIPYLEGL